MVRISVKICFLGQTGYQRNAENNINDMSPFRSGYVGSEKGKTYGISIGDKMKKKIHVYGRKLLRNFLYVMGSYIAQIILSSVGVLEFWNKDINFFTIKGCLIGLAVIIIVEILYILSQHNMTPFHIWIKACREYIIICLIVLEIFFLYKCNSTLRIEVCITEFTIILFLLDCEITKMYRYDLRETADQDLNYIEKPVIGRSYLTKAQTETLDQLKTLIDNRSKSDSFNIALIGTWGCGKTSITDTLIYEYEKDNEKYFLLKMSSLTLKESQNIVMYVRDYFEDLFRKYEIGIAKRNVAFLTTLANSFSEKLSLPDMFSKINNECFIDIEKEKEVFSKQVSKLLDISGRKNIILLIDDTDRSEDENEIIKLLSEFASIPGIISVVSLDKSKDRSIRPNEIVDDEKSICNLIDKYIHVRIRVREDKHIEYDKNISKQIIDSFENLVPNENCYISCDGVSGRNSLFEKIVDCQTIEIVNKNTYVHGTTDNILSTIFMYNMEYGSRQFGDYLGKLVNEYICNSKEIVRYMEQMVAIPSEEWSTESKMVIWIWTNFCGKEEVNWLMRLKAESEKIFWKLVGFNETIKLNTYEKLTAYVKNIDDLYICSICCNNGENCSKIAKIDRNTIFWGDLLEIKQIVFGIEKYDTLNQVIGDGKFDEAQKIIEEKIQLASNLYFLALELQDFMSCVQLILNNRRTFKMQIREAEITNENYLEYLIHEWKPRKSMKKMIENMKEQNSALSNIDIEFPSIPAFINNMLFKKYVLSYGKNFKEGELSGCKLFLYTKKEEPLIIIKKHKSDYVVLNIMGNRIENMEEDVMRDIISFYDSLD